MKLNLMMLLLVFVVSFSVKGTPFISGDHTGNGGDVVICNDQSSNLVRVLDYYEVSELHFLKTKPFYNSTVEKITEELINRTFFSDRDKRHYSERAAQFMKRITWSENDLPDIRDSHHTYLPPSCVIKQIAINKLNGNIVINRNLWGRLNNENKATLIFHELVYEDLIFSGYKDSIIARLIISHALADEPVKTDFGSSTTSFYQFMWNALGTLSVEEKKRVLKYSPLLKKFAFDSLIRLEKLDFEAQQIALDIAKTEYFSGLLISFRGIGNLYADFSYDFLTIGIKSLKNHQVIDSQSSYEFFYGIRNIARRFNNPLRNEGLFLEVLNLYDFDSGPSVIFHLDSYLEFFHHFPFFTHNQNHVEKVLARTVKVLGNYKSQALFKFLARIPIDISIGHSLIEQVFNRLRELSGDFSFSPWGIPHPATYSFFVKRGIYIESMMPLFKKFLSNELSTQDSFNYPFRWFLENESYVGLASELKAELKKSALHFFNITELRKNLEIYYDHFHEPIDPLHRKALLDHFYKGNHSTSRRDFPLNVLFEAYNQTDDEIQNAYAYGLRFEREHRYGKPRYINHLKRFPSFTEFTNSVLLLEMRKGIQKEEFLLSVLELFLTRAMNEDVRSFVKFLRNDPRDSIRLMAIDLLSIE